MFLAVKNNNIKLSHISLNDDLAAVCRERFEAVESGFVEGFFGGKDNLKIPAYIAEIVDSLSQVALLYNSLAAKIEKKDNRQNVFDAIIDCDKMAVKSIGFVIENYTLPHIAQLQRKPN